MINNEQCERWSQVVNGKEVFPRYLEDFQLQDCKRKLQETRALKFPMDSRLKRCPICGKELRLVAEVERGGSKWRWFVCHAEKTDGYDAYNDVVCAIFALYAGYFNNMTYESAVSEWRKKIDGRG